MTVNFRQCGDFDLVFQDDIEDSFIVNLPGLNERWAESSDCSALVYGKIWRDREGTW
jgi:hypothetical protein